MLTLAGAGDPTLALDHHDRLLPFFDAPENCKSSFNHCFKCLIINKAFFNATEKANHGLWFKLPYDRSSTLDFSIVV